MEKQSTTLGRMIFESIRDREAKIQSLVMEFRHLSVNSIEKALERYVKQLSQKEQEEVIAIIVKNSNIGVFEIARKMANSHLKWEEFRKTHRVKSCDYTFILTLLQTNPYLIALQEYKNIQEKSVLKHSSYRTRKRGIRGYTIKLS